MSSLPKAHAFFDPTGPVQVMYLGKILIEDYKRFSQLQSMIQAGQAQTDFLRWVNAGIDNVVGLMSTLPIKDEQLLGDLKDYQRALGTVNRIYGNIPKSQESSMQTLHDQTVAESFRVTNSIKDYAAAQEENANKAFQMANQMSPKGAERLNATTSAQILHALTQLLRVNGELLKLQGEHFALTNKQDKTSVEHFNKISKDLKSSFARYSGDMALPAF